MSYKLYNIVTILILKYKWMQEGWKPTGYTDRSSEES